MRLSEILRLVWLNLSQNKFKVILTSIGIVVGSATIMLVLAIGTGGKEEVAEQFKNLNAGAIDISCDSSDSGGFSFEMPGGGGSVTVTNMGGDPRGGSGGGTSGGPGGGMDFGGFFGFGQEEESEAVTLTSEDCDDLATFVSGISATTISYSTTASVEGGDMTSASYYTIAGVEDNYATISNLEMAIGDFLTEENNESKEKVCVLGATVAKEIFGSAYDAYDGTVYIDGRPYIDCTVIGILYSVRGIIRDGNGGIWHQPRYGDLCTLRNRHQIHHRYEHQSNHHGHRGGCESGGYRNDGCGECLKRKLSQHHIYHQRCRKQDGGSLCFQRDTDITVNLHGGDRIYRRRYRYYERAVCIHQGAYQRDRYFESAGLFPEGYPVGVFIGSKLYQSGRGRTGGAGGSWNYAIRAAVQRESVPVGTGCSIVAVVWCPHRKYLRLLSGI